jgi:signal transduction histidine kinase
MDVLQTTRLTPLVEIGRAAAGAADRAGFLPVAARETARLLGARACEIWLDDDGPVLTAAFRPPDGAPRSLEAEALAAVLGQDQAWLDGWLCLDIPGDVKTLGILAVARDEPWSPDDAALAEAVTCLIGLGLTVVETGRLGDEARGEFLALLGHDLRSPLSNVRIGAQLARRNLEAGDIDSVRRALEIIESQSGRLVARLEALLEALAADGRVLIRLEPLDLPAMVAATIEPLRLAAEQSGAGTTFELSVEPGTPAARGDAVQIGQVLEQLLDNAAKHAAGGHVTVRLSPADAFVKVEVCDTGSGIRPEDLHRVFAPFGRGRDSAHREGYGLGLYLARNIVASHGGRLWIARTSRSGTCMAFLLPAVGADET